jgi:hypothetical protein
LSFLQCCGAAGTGAREGAVTAAGPTSAGRLLDVIPLPHTSALANCPFAAWQRPFLSSFWATAGLLAVATRTKPAASMAIWRITPSINMRCNNQDCYKTLRASGG